MSSDGGSDSVGNDSSSTSSASQSTTDSLSAAAESLSAGLQGAMDAVADALSGQLGGIADALGLDQVADALGLDTLDLDSVFGAAVTGMLTGGLPGAVMGVANALTGGALADAARNAVNDNLPAEFQGLANMAIDAMASRIPGAAASMNLNNPLADIAQGMLTNGRVPGVDQFGHLARTATEFADVAQNVMQAASQGNWNDALDAAASIDTHLRDNLDVARSVARQVGVDFGAGHTLTAQGGHGPLGDAAERLAIATAELMAVR